MRRAQLLPIPAQSIEWDETKHNIHNTVWYRTGEYKYEVLPSEWAVGVRSRITCTRWYDPRLLVLWKP
jgi:hypothetical protein